VLQKIIGLKTNEKHLDMMALILRLVVASLMLTHGFPKLSKLLAGGEIHFANPLGLGPVVSLYLVVFAEFFCSVAIALGVGTRLATLPLMFTMSVAAFITHASDPIGRKELALLYLIIYVTLFILGSRKFSIDYWLLKKKQAI
jgi:putative oxidoreductase